MPYQRCKVVTYQNNGKSDECTRNQLSFEMLYDQGSPKEIDHLIPAVFSDKLTENLTEEMMEETQNN